MSLVQNLINGDIDIQAFSAFLNADAATDIPRRLNLPVHSLSHYEQYLEALKLVYTQTTGTVTVNGVSVKPITVAVRDAIDNVILGGYKTQLEQQIASLAGGRKSYKTYAEMVANKAEIPANSTVDVTNDTTTANNGAYNYDGTTFTKSLYDPVTQSKVYTDTAKTAAISTASTDATTKANAAKSEAITAAATDATTKINAAKTDAITAAGIDAAAKDSVLKEYTNKELEYKVSAVKGKNLFNENSDYVLGISLPAVTTLSGEYDRTLTKNLPTATSAVIRVEPNTTYTVSKGTTVGGSIAGRVFLLATSKTYLGAIKMLTTSENNLEYTTTITTDSEAKYLYVYVATSTETIPTFLQIEKGSVKTSWETYGVKPVGVKIKNNNLFDASRNYITGYEIPALSVLSGEYDSNLASPRPLSTIGVIEVKPNTTYTVSKGDGSVVGRNFKIATSKTYLGKVRVLTLAENDSKSVTTITTDSEARYLYVQVASNLEALPSYLKIEEGSSPTAWYAEAERVIKLATPLYEKPSGTNAGFHEKGDPNVYTSDAKIAYANDSTKYLQSLFDAGGFVELEKGMMYKVSDTLKIDLQRVKGVSGNGSTIVNIADKTTLEIHGANDYTANPEHHDLMNMKKAAINISGFSITSSSGEIGEGVNIINCFMLELDVQCYYMRKGIRLTGRNRNLRIKPKCYAMTEAGLYFAPTCDLHQAQFYDSDISYCKNLIHFDDCSVYNIQFTGGDLELANYSLSDGTLMVNSNCVKINTASKYIHDIIFSGVTFEAHVDAEYLIDMRSTYEDILLISYITFEGCHFTNPTISVFKLDNVQNINVTGQIGYAPEYLFDCVGNVRNLTVNGNTTGGRTTEGGGIFRAVGNFLIENIKLNVNSQTLTRGAVLTDCNIKGFVLANSILCVDYIVPTRLPANVGIVDIKTLGRTVDMVNVSSNVFSLPEDREHIIKIGAEATNVNKTGNISNRQGAL